MENNENLSAYLTSAFFYNEKMPEVSTTLCRIRAYTWIRKTFNFSDEESVYEFLKNGNVIDSSCSLGEIVVQFDSSNEENYAMYDLLQSQDASQQIATVTAKVVAYENLGRDQFYVEKIGTTLLSKLKIAYKENPYDEWVKKTIHCIAIVDNF